MVVIYLCDFSSFLKIHLFVGRESNFDKYDWDVVTTFNLEYDYNSVLHYSAYAFSVNEEKTIVTLVSYRS